MENAPEYSREIVLFLVILAVCSFFSIRAAHRHQIKIYQALAILALLIYLGVVFASTVFTRMPTVRQYELILFWSWYCRATLSGSQKHHFIIANFSRKKAQSHLNDTVMPLFLHSFSSVPGY